jgi:hypothetical protein
MENDLQDLYLHLEHPMHGNLYIAWYGQERATGKTHAEAIASAVERFGLADSAWYQHRMMRRANR